MREGQSIPRSEIEPGETLKDLKDEDIDSGLSVLEEASQKEAAERADKEATGGTGDTGDVETPIEPGETLKDLKDEDIDSGLSALEEASQKEVAERADKEATEE